MADNPYEPERPEDDPARQPASRMALTIGTVKTMAHKYGIDTLLEAFKELRGRLEAARPDSSDALRLHLVGGGPDLGRGPIRMACRATRSRR